MLASIKSTLSVQLARGASLGLCLLKASSVNIPLTPLINPQLTGDGYSINTVADTEWTPNQLLSQLSVESQLIFSRMPLSVDQYIWVS